MIDTTADKLLLVLSTDWFAPYWPSIGLYVAKDKKADVQRRLREEVRRSFLGRTYWHAAFDASRVESTSGALLAAFEGNAGEATRQALLALAGKGQLVHESGREIWLLSTMTEMLVDSGDESLSADLIDAIRRAWNLSQSGSTDWLEVCEGSSTEWDLSVQSLTPDIPCWLADFIAAEIEDVDQFGMFWSELHRLATESMIDGLRDWYKAAAIALTDEDVDLRCIQ
jgi:hypothetical protein